MKWWILIFALALLFSCDSGGSTNDQPPNSELPDPNGGDESSDDPSSPLENSILLHEVTEHGGWANVGQSEYVNGYRGIYWIGPSSRVDRVEICLNYEGDVSAVEYRMGAWTVDTADHLQLVEETAQSNVRQGSAIILDSNDTYAGAWVTFTFPEPAILATGSTALLIYRVDGETDISNYIRVNNPYDTDDEINDQANLHYDTQGTMAGRGPGDEDQPEPFAVKIRVYGETFNVPDSQEFPAQPIRLNYSAGPSAGTVDLSWEYRSTAVIPLIYNVYNYNESNGEKTLLGSVDHNPDQAVQSYLASGLTTGENYFFVVCAVAANGNESYHSLTPEDSNFAPEPVTAP